MADFYFIYSIIDIIWKIFSILFVLYRFTSFFTMIYEFFKFLGKLLKGFVYVKEQIVVYIRKRNNYGFDNLDLPIKPDSFFTVLKQNCKKLYNKIFGTTLSNNNMNMPLYETQTEMIHNPFIEIDDIESESECDVFNFKNKSELNISNDIFYSNHIYPPPKKNKRLIEEQINMHMNMSIDETLNKNNNNNNDEYEALLDDSDPLYLTPYI